MIPFLWYSGNGIITGTKNRSVIAKVGEEVDYKGTLWGNFQGDETVLNLNSGSGYMTAFIKIHRTLNQN